MMAQRVTDLNISKNEALPSPAELAAEIVRSPDDADFIIDARRQVNEVIFGNDDNRMIVVVGPCSIHDVDAGKIYAEKLKALSDKVSEKLLIVMRVYFEKPRTTTGWKGLIMDPHLNGTDDIPNGLRLARHFLRTVTDIGIPAATELLDPITPQYIGDFISWSAIGARTTESQTHRQMASGLSMPLGFKNATNGSLQCAVNAIKAARAPQTFLGVSFDGIASAVSTKGNPSCHIILRGGEEMGPNYKTNFVTEAVELLEKNDLPAAVMIDASHDNSGKNHENQPDVFADIVAQKAGGSNAVIGAMIESNLVAGKQKLVNPNDLITGQSITDGCIDWETTERILCEAAEKL